MSDSRQTSEQSIQDEVEREVFGKWVDSFNVDKLTWLAAGVSSSNYAMKHMEGAARFGGPVAILNFCVAEAPAEGLFLEFGVFSGTTITRTALLRPQSKIYGFDSFQGLPEDWRSDFPKGCFARNNLPAVPANVELVVGWFDHTLPGFCDTHPDQKIAYLHVDCDIYSSTQTIFTQLKDRIVPGTIILFDEYFNYPYWEKHEAKAFAEFCEWKNVRYEYIGLVPHHQQVGVRIL